MQHKVMIYKGNYPRIIGSKKILYREDTQKLVHTLEYLRSDIEHRFSREGVRCVVGDRDPCSTEPVVVSLSTSAPMDTLRADLSEFIGHLNCSTGFWGGFELDMIELT